MSKWMEWEKIMCAEMKGAGKNIREIAAALNRPYGSVDSHLRQEQTNIARRRREMGMPKLRAATVANVTVPPSVIAERDRRLNEYRSPAQILMGEPPFSQSALARRS